jgi:hypothetical protein
MSHLIDNPDSYNSLIISMSEVMLREGINLQKGMNFRDNEMRLSIFLVLEREEVFCDYWNVNRSLFSYQGHDSIAEGSHGSADDQLLMYASGKSTDNGKFYKLAQAFKDGLRESPLQIQVYEKLDPGVFFDKGIFNLVDATYGKISEKSENPVKEIHSRKIACFYLSPADAQDRAPSYNERMIDPIQKAAAWKQTQGRCVVCMNQSNMHFKDIGKDSVQLLCSLHLTL